MFIEDKQLTGGLGREWRIRQAKRLWDKTRLAIWFNNLISGHLGGNPLTSLLLKTGKIVKFTVYSWGKRQSLPSVLFSFLFLLFFLSVFNCYLYFCWELRHLLSWLRGAVHGKDKGWIHFAFPWVSFILLHFFPPPIIHHHPLPLFTFLISLFLWNCYS